jgi:predicted RND superfamily exporter protein
LEAEVQIDDIVHYGGDPEQPADSEVNRTATERLRARQLGDRLGLFTTGNYHENWGGQNERWLLGDKDDWYYVTPAGQVFRWSGQPNASGFLWRATERLVKGRNTATGELVGTFGKPSTAEEPNPYYADPRKLTARFFKTIMTGPETLGELTKPGGPLWPRGGDLSDELRPLLAKRHAHERLTGTLFGPAVLVPEPFDWTPAGFERLLGAEASRRLPRDWQESFELFVNQIVKDRFQGQVELLRSAPRLTQAALTDELCYELKIEPRQFWFTWTPESFLARLTDDERANLPEDWQERFARFIGRMEQEYGSREALVEASSLAQTLAWEQFYFELGMDPPPRQTAVIVTFSEAGKRDPRRVIGRALMGKPLGRLLQIAEEAGISQDQLKLGGPPVDNVAIDEEGTITLFRLIGWSAAIGIGLSYLCFRSVKITIMIFFVGGVSAIGSLSIVWWTGSAVDAVLMSMPALVYVLGLSGAIHIVNYYRESVEECGLIGAPERAVSHGWGPCTLCAGTTAIGLISLYSSTLYPIQKFGLYSAIGVMATLTLLFTYLPSALQTWPPGYQHRHSHPVQTSRWVDRLDHFWVAMGRWIIRYNGLVITGTLIIMGITGVGLLRLNTSVQLLKLFDQDAKIIRDYRWLEANFGKLVPMELVVCFQPQVVMNESAEPSPTQRMQYNVLERIEIAQRVQHVVEHYLGEAGADVVGQGVSAATFAPPLPGVTSDRERGVYNQGLAEELDRIRSEDYHAVDPRDKRELWRVSLRLGALNDVDYGGFVSELKRTVEPILEAHRVRDEILRALEQQTGGNGFRDTAVLLLGHNPNRVDREKAANASPAPAATSTATPPTPSTTDVATNAVPASDSNTPPPAAADASYVSDADQTTIFVETLNELLQIEGFRAGMRSKSRLAWHDPVETPLSEISEEAWRKQLGIANVVVLVDQPDVYDLDFLRQHAKVWIDASQHRFDPEHSKTAVERGEPLNVVYTGVVPVVYKAQRMLLESLVESIGSAFVMITTVMMVLLRDWRAPFGWRNSLNFSAGLISMLPNVLPLVLIFGTMGHLNILVDIGTMMTASVALGVAVDDTIHFLSWFRIGLRAGMERNDAILQAYRKVGTAMLQTTLVGGLGLAVFAASTFTPTQRFGVMMVTLLTAALLGDLIFLPALLAGPLGRAFCPPTIRKGTAGTALAPDPITGTMNVADESHEVNALTSSSSGSDQRLAEGKSVAVARDGITHAGGIPIFHNHLPSQSSPSAESTSR